jgi:hypothetical protein
LFEFARIGRPHDILLVVAIVYVDAGNVDIGYEPYARWVEGVSVEPLITEEDR